jgi:hypothetical protein
MRRVTLLYPHTHDGVQHASGVTLTVPDTAARWLLDYRIAIPADRPRQPVTVPAPQAPATAPEPLTETPAPPIADTATTGDTP